MSLNVGDVFSLRNFGFSGTDPHYHIVLFKTPTNQIITCYTTSNQASTYKSCRRDEEDLESHCEPMTYVVVEPDDCPEVITNTSYISANKIQMKSEEDYEKGVEFELIAGCKMNPRIIKQVLEGIPYSGTVPEIIKRTIK
ncbi:MAG: hypothetical protein ABSC53_03435 [Bacteroidota bacterium]|jgi:hypothetical protein